jgi:hypothetical protein
MKMGTRIGRYQIGDSLGAGGMGEVYRARDGTLGRDVAIKVLPRALASDPESLARFEREARALAALNHPHIAAIYGFEDPSPSTDSMPAVRALVLELVEGPTLADRLEKGPLPVVDAVAIARQIAEALEAAHEKGIVHRDLKPANVKLTADGSVKVLDFGIAKMVDLTVTGGGTESATMTEARTMTGVIVGTAAYMSPEQSLGQPVDKRADIWAFGCVLYELLTGRPAFAGTNFADTLARVQGREPDWSLLPATTPTGVRRLLGRCLEKDPRRRLRDIGDARIELEDTADGTREQAGAPSPRRSRLGMAWIPISLTLVAVAAGMAGWLLRPSEAPEVRRFSHMLPEGQAFTQPARPLVAIAPDGSSIVFVADNGLYRRPLDELAAVPIRGTEGVPSTPFFSPDGQSLGYWDVRAEELRRISVSGGTSVTLARATNVYGASWGVDDAILYGQEDGIWRVPARGGTPERLIEIGPDERVHGPQLLPGGRAVLFSLIAVASIGGQQSAWDAAQVVVHSLDGGERRFITRGSDARYVPSGHLVYALGTVLFAQPFDLTTRAVKGGPVPIVEGVQRAVQFGGSSGSANYDFTRQGTLVYVPVGGASPADVPRSLFAVDHEGNAEPLVDERLPFWRPRISPDGRRVAVQVQKENFVTEIWIVDLRSRTMTQLAEAGTTNPVWAPDGQSVFYHAGQRDTSGIYVRAADGTGEEVLLLPGMQLPTDVSREGILVFSEGPQTGQRAIRTVDLQDKSVSDFLDTPAMEHMPAFSPDGKWLAYASNASGQDEVYVRPYPRTEGVARRVSVGGGTGPVWAPDGSALYYRGASGDLMAVPTTLSPTFTTQRPRALFPFRGKFRVSGNVAAYDVHPDGRRFIMVSEEEANILGEFRQLDIVLNWFQELKNRAPAAR